MVIDTGFELQPEADPGDESLRPRIATNPMVWLGLANVTVLSAALVASLRREYVWVTDGAWDQLPDPRWAVAVAVLGLVVLLAKPGMWGRVVALATLVAGLGVFLYAASSPIAYPELRLDTRNPLRLESFQTWKYWIDSPMRAESLAAASLASIALLLFVLTWVLNRGSRTPPLRSDGRWWAAAGSFGVLVIATAALLRLSQTQDTMHREIGTMGFLALTAVVLGGLGASLAARRPRWVWLGIVLLAMAAAMFWGPALAWAEGTREWPGSALIHQEMVVEGVAGFLLGTVAVVAAVVCQARSTWDSGSVTSAT